MRPAKLTLDGRKYVVLLERDYLLLKAKAALAAPARRRSRKSLR